MERILRRLRFAPSGVRLTGAYATDAEPASGSSDRDLSFMGAIHRVGQKGPPADLAFTLAAIRSYCDAFWVFRGVVLEAHFQIVRNPEKATAAAFRRVSAEHCENG
jgi:hypothetical protein